MTPAELLASVDRLCIQIASRWRTAGRRVGLGVDDLRQAARMGAWQAAMAFDPGRGAKFTSLAAKYAANAIKDCVGYQGGKFNGKALSWAARERLAIEPATEDGGLAALIRRDEADALLATIDAESRTIVREWAAGASNRETAARMGLGSSGVQWRMQRAFRAMRQAAGVTQ